MKKIDETHLTSILDKYCGHMLEYTIGGLIFNYLPQHSKHFGCAYCSC